MTKTDAEFITLAKSVMTVHESGMATFSLSELISLIDSLSRRLEMSNLDTKDIARHSIEQAGTNSYGECKKIQAIKIFRDVTGQRLKDSKEVIEAAMAEMGIK